MEPKRFAATLDSLGPVRDYLKSAAQTAGLDKKATYEVCLAVDEIATNIILHGYEEAGRSGVLDVHVDMGERQLTVTLEDDGEPFDPRQSKLPEDEDLLRPLEERPIGGLGLYLAFQGVDEFRYERAGGRNRNIFVVYLQSADQTREPSQS
ncbi:MAG: ATP-binding protein [Deltaproteobacteria bacterium]|nr:ATP-binding protein [Deltaproteobacteria bacterium]